MLNLGIKNQKQAQASNKAALKSTLTHVVVQVSRMTNNESNQCLNNTVVTVFTSDT